MIDDYTCETDVRSLLSDPRMTDSLTKFKINSTMGDGIKFRGQGLYHFRAVTVASSETMCTLTAEFKIFAFQVSLHPDVASLNPMKSLSTPPIQLITGANLTASSA